MNGPKLAAFAATILIATTSYAASPTLYRMPPVEEVLSANEITYRGQLGETVAEQVSFLGESLGIGHGKGDSCGKADCDNCREGCVDSAQLFLGFDSWAARLDDDDSNNFGFRSGFNVARRVSTSDWFWQAGAAYGVYDIDGHEMGDTTDNEEQIFVTLGGFRRSNLCCGRRLTIGGVVDYLHDENVGEEHNMAIDIYQARYRVGYATNAWDEIGFTGAMRINSGDPFNTANFGPFTVNALEHSSLYWERRCDNNARIMASIGWLSEPGEVLFGVNGEAPLSESVAIFGNFNYGKPSTSPGDFAPNAVEQSYSEAYWNITFGLVYYFRGSAGADSTPLMPVGNNGNFMIAAPVGAL